MKTGTPAVAWRSTLRRAVIPRLRFLGPFVLAGMLVWIGLLRLRPMLAESERLTREITEARTRLQSLEIEVRRPVTDGSDVTVDDWCRKLQGDAAESADWLKAASTAAGGWGWRVQSEVGEVTVHPVAETLALSVPIQLRLQPESGSGRSSTFLRLLRFGEWLQNTPRRPRVTSLAVVAGPQGIRDCRMDLELRFLTPRQ